MFKKNQRCHLNSAPYNFFNHKLITIPSFLLSLSNYIYNLSSNIILYPPPPQLHFLHYIFLSLKVLIITFLLDYFMFVLLDMALGLAAASIAWHRWCCASHLAARLMARSMCRHFTCFPYCIKKTTHKKHIYHVYKWEDNLA